MTTTRSWTENKFEACKFDIVPFVEWGLGEYQNGGGEDKDSPAIAISSSLPHIGNRPGSDLFVNLVFILCRGTEHFQ